MEFFIVSNSFAAPFVSDTHESFEEAATARKALTQYAARYSHPARLFSADCYASATDYHKGKRPLARWLCNQEIAKQKVSKGKSAFSYEAVAPGRFKIDGELVIVEKPYEGKLVPIPA